MIDFIQHNWLPISSSFLGGLLIGWAMIISHRGADKKLWKMTLVVAIPLVVMSCGLSSYGTFETYSSNEKQKVQTEHEQSEIEKTGKLAQDLEVKNALIARALSIESQNQIQLSKNLSDIGKAVGNLDNYVQQNSDQIGQLSDTTEQFVDDTNQNFSALNQTVQNASEINQSLEDTMNSVNTTEQQNQDNAQQLQMKLNQLQTTIQENQNSTLDGFNSGRERTDCFTRMAVAGLPFSACY